MAEPRNKRRPRSGRPRNTEQQVTVMAGNQLMSWPSKLRQKLGEFFELYNADDLIGKKGFAIYREMRHDDTVKACLKFKKVLIHGRDWEIEPVGGKDATEEQKKHAKFVEDCLREINFNAVQRETLTALDYGYSVGEILWKVEEFKDYGLKVILDGIKHRDPEYIKIEVDIHGNITQFRQVAMGLPLQEIDIIPDKVIHYAYQSEFSNHYGISDLRAAYRAWWSKKFITQFWNIFLERFGQPLMMMKYPQGASSDLLTKLRNILSSLSSRSDILVPEGVIVELIEATRAGTAQYGEAINHCDVGISRAVLVPALLGMGVDVKRGSDSQSRLHLRVLMKVANDISEDLEHIFSSKIAKPLVDMNFSDVKEFPRFVFRDYGEYEAVEIVDSIRELFNAGVLDVDQDDINYARSILGLPLRDEGEEDEVLRSVPPPIGTSPNDPNNPGLGSTTKPGSANRAKPSAGATQGNKRAQKGPSTAPSKRAK